MEVRRWPCPNCGESIPVIALECRFCHKPPRFVPAVRLGSIECAVIMARHQRRMMEPRPSPEVAPPEVLQADRPQSEPRELVTLDQAASMANRAKGELPPPSRTVEAIDPTPAPIAASRPPRGQDKAIRCIGLYVDALERGETPPTPSELARQVGCNPGTASRAVGRWEAGRREDAKGRRRCAE